MFVLLFRLLDNCVSKPLPLLLVKSTKFLCSEVPGLAKHSLLGVGWAEEDTPVPWSHGGISHASPPTTTFTSSISVLLESRLTYFKGCLDVCFLSIFVILRGRDKQHHTHLKNLAPEAGRGERLLWYRTPGGPQMMLLDRYKHQRSHSLTWSLQPTPVTPLAYFTENQKESAPGHGSLGEAHSLLYAFL